MAQILAVNILQFALIVYTETIVNVFQDTDFWLKIYENCHCKIINIDESMTISRFTHPLVYYSSQYSMMTNLTLPQDLFALKTERCRATLLLLRFTQEDLITGHNSTVPRSILDTKYLGSELTVSSFSYIHIATKAVGKQVLELLTLNLFNNYYFYRNIDFTRLSILLIAAGPNVDSDSFFIDEWYLNCYYCTNVGYQKIVIHQMRRSPESKASRRIIDNFFYQSFRKSSIGLKSPVFFVEKYPVMGLRLSSETKLEEVAVDWDARFSTLKSDHRSFHSLILHILMGKLSNTSYVFPERNNQFMESIPAVELGMPQIWHYEFIPTKTEGLAFFTCDGIVERTSFEVYYNPFQLLLWCVLSAFVLSLSVILHIGSKRQISAIQSVLLSVGILLEQFDIPKLPKNMMKFFNIIMLAWMLMGIILSHGYKGILTSDVTAPRPKNVLQNFKEIEDYAIFTPPSKTLVRHMKTSLFIRNRMYEATRTKYMQRDEKGIKVIDQFFDVYEISQLFEYFHNPEYQNPTTRWETSKEQVNWLMNSLRLPHDFPNSSAETAVSHCNRTAYVTYRSDIDQFVVPDFMKNDVTKRRFTRGKEEILYAFRGYGSSNRKGGGYFFKYLRLLLESGVYQMAEATFVDLERSKNCLKYLNTTDYHVQVLNLGSNFMTTLFQILSSLFLVNVGTFFVEFFMDARFYFVFRFVQIFRYHCKT
ncbi:unnamed protein product [Allacma fusca]|uniref:Ionotropic receptor n=1 Tax=Allacma fusca TaxID=39272 RepID=A0A8J2NUG3_9HEXA|nr:unnamed protein product [Allacma fusca]